MKQRKRILLLQLRRAHGGTRPYLPNGLLNLGTRLAAADVDVRFQDLNFRGFGQEVRDADMIGISIIGPPAIAEAWEQVRALRGKRFERPILIGGEGAIRLTDEQFKEVFDDFGDVRLVRTDRDLIDALGLDSVPNAFDASMAPMLAKIPRAVLREYLSEEFCLFLSSGCVFNCLFCAAAKGQPERYRSLEGLRDEVASVARHASKLGIRELRAYLSNLDIMQTPDRLVECLEAVASIAEARGVSFRLRGLATSRFLVRSIDKDPGLLSRLRGLGLECIGFGVDGADVETWRSQRKRHNTPGEIDRALRAVLEAGMDAEALMVIGFPGESRESLARSFRFSLHAAKRGVVVRPYLAKTCVPGSYNWNERPEIVARLLADPRLFRHLDYAMLASGVTHASRADRLAANVAYGAILCMLIPFGGSPTRPLLPPYQKGAAFEQVARLLNGLMPHDR